jgi:hypothetical protein
LRIIGGAIFTLGGVTPLVWYVMRKRKRFTKTVWNEEEQTNERAIKEQFEAALN